MLSIYKPNGIILDDVAINMIYRLFNKMSTYIGITPNEIDKLHNVLLKYVDFSDYLNIDVELN